MIPCQQRLSRIALLTGVLGALLLPLSGCGPRASVVSGKVTYRNKPVVSGSVTFFCQDGQIVSGLLTSDGTYSIPNVPYGTVKVAVATHPPVPPAFELNLVLPPSKDAPSVPRVKAPRARRSGSNWPAIPDRYSDPDRSGWSLTVNAASHSFDLDLGR